MIICRSRIPVFLLALLTVPAFLPLPAYAVDRVLILRAASDATYDAEHDIGLVAEDATQEVAEANTAKLSNALMAQWRGSSFTFANGSTGPVLRPIVCAPKQFFFYGPIKTSNRVGGELIGGGGRPGYQLPENQYTTDSGTYGGMNTRFTRIDGENGGGVIRLRGSGFVLVGIDLKGQRWTEDSTVEGTASEACVEIEGRNEVASGKHVISNCALGFANRGIKALAGYYDDDDEFVELPASGPQQGFGVHADETIVEACTFVQINSCIRSENEQAANWSLRDLTVGGSTAFQPIVIDAVRGGKWTHTGTLTLNHPTVTVLRVGNYSPYTNRFDIGTLSWDHFSGAGDYCRLVDVALPAQSYVSVEGLHVRMYGSLSRDYTEWDSEPADQKLFQFTPGITNLNCTKMLFDFNNGMPTQFMTNAAQSNDDDVYGPWWYPNAADWILAP